MIPLWLLFTALAVVSQTIRTAGQKQLSLTLNAETVTYSRYFFGTPFVIAYFYFQLHTGNEQPAPGLYFWVCATIAAFAQIAATILMVRLFHRRNFAVGITYIRSEAFLTALIGAAFFHDPLGWMSWIAILISVLGVLVMNRAKTEGGAEGAGAFIASPSAIIGLSSGLLFAITSILIRKGGLSLGLDNKVLAGATTLLAVVMIQTVAMTLWFLVRDRPNMVALARQWRLGWFIGLTSALGSIGWFTAMTLENAGVVKSVGQVELILSLGVSVFIFKEKVRSLEIAGMALMMVGIIALLLYH